MSKRTITGGDTTFVVGNKTAPAFERFREWYKRDPSVAVEQVALAGAPSPRTHGELVRMLIHTWGISRTVVSILGDTHAAVAGRWLQTVAGSKKSTTSVDDEHPRNYSERMARLKNLRWPGWDGSAIKGYCVFEPAVRMEQLISFPVEQFGTPNLPQLPEWPVAPTGAHDARQLGSDLHSDILACEADVQLWEKYYDELAEKLVVLNRALECGQPAHA